MQQFYHVPDQDLHIFISEVGDLAPSHKLKAIITITVKYLSLRVPAGITI